eukprot:TRINITY_DN28670_c0_g1_i1.p1 TRINITY_DN28670_c0_g1~~TRINITY_DN28670_c0_g1_i1.p1  ORF type:complete len:799 (+),score=157.84 TRINITY_DN28670_c0_g1_i1:40-2397(+)
MESPRHIERAASAAYEKVEPAVHWARQTVPLADATARRLESFQVVKRLEAAVPEAIQAADCYLDALAAKRAAKTPAVGLFGRVHALADDALTCSESVVDWALPAGTITPVSGTPDRSLVGRAFAVAFCIPARLSRTILRLPFGASNAGAAAKAALEAETAAKRDRAAIEEARGKLEALGQLKLPLAADKLCAQALESLKKADDPAAAEEAKLPVTGSRAPQMTEGSLAPINSIVSILWPRIDHFLHDLVYNQIEPNINRALPGMLRGRVKFTKLTLGESSPLLGPLWVEHKEDTGAIEIHLGINFSSGLDVQITAMGVKIEIAEIIIQGELVVLLAPPIKKPPFFGAMEIYFPNPPHVGISFGGAARIADVPGLRGAIRKAIDGCIGGICVLPRRIAVDLNDEDDVDIVDLTYPEPEGILRLTLWSASNLPAVEKQTFGPPTSNPYVVAHLGIESWQSPVVKKNLNPVWGGDEGLVLDLPVHDDCQLFSLKVFDHEVVQSDDLLGEIQRVKVRELMTKSFEEGSKIELPLLNDKCKDSDAKNPARITVSAEYLKLSANRDRAKMRGPTVAHLSVKVLTVRGMGLKPDGIHSEEGAKVLTSEFPFRLRVQLHSRRPQTQKTGSWIPFGKSAKTGPPPADLLGEATSNKSKPQCEKELAKTLQGICLQLHSRGHTAAEVADILDVSQQQVQTFLKNHDASSAEKAHDYARRSVWTPRFDEVVQLLLPSVNEAAVVELSVLDKNGKSLGSAHVPMEQILEQPDFSIEGPFFTDTQLEVVGKLWLHWLV